MDSASLRLLVEASRAGLTEVAMHDVTGVFPTIRRFIDLSTLPFQ